MNKTNHAQSATRSFLARKAEIDAMLNKLQALSDNHFNVNPEEVHWGHVGDLSRYSRLLKELTDGE